MKGHLIKTLDDLDDAAHKRKSVVCGSGKPQAAAFVLCMQAERVMRMIRNGLYVYEPKNKPSAPWSGKGGAK